MDNPFFFLSTLYPFADTYLAVYPAIGDAIDQDSSGYLSVIEVNHFFERKPQGWSSCEWIA